MSILAFIIGILFPTVNGTVLVRLIEGHTPSLARTERITIGCMLGMTLMMLIVFIGHTLVRVPLTLWTFVIVHILCSVILLYLWAKHKLSILERSTDFPASQPLSTTAKILCGILGAWIVVKIVMTSSVFLLLTPTYLDDTLDNWNLRGKVFFYDHAITLVMPGEDAAHSPLGVSSYPPTVPLLKSWLAFLAGNWSDALVNSIHVVWYIAALILIYFAIRRHANVLWSCLGTYILASIPLYLMHGTNPYADAFVSVHIFIAISMLFHASVATTDHARSTFLKISALAAALLPFTKNEGLLVYLPPLLVLVALLTWIWKKKQILSNKKIIQTYVLYAGLIALLSLPWLLFKWMNRLTFGNAKPVTTLGIGWQENVLTSIFINTFFEGNWLLLFPLLFALMLWRWKAAFSRYAILTLFFLMIYVGQGMLYLFTGLSIEALQQTGYARGLVQLTPTVVLLLAFLLLDASPTLFNALAKSEK